MGRNARVGDVIEIVRKKVSDDPFDLGDILTVEAVEARNGLVTRTDKHRMYCNGFGGILYEEYKIIAEVGQE